MGRKGERVEGKKGKVSEREKGKSKKVLTLTYESPFEIQRERGAGGTGST